MTFFYVRMWYVDGGAHTFLIKPYIPQFYRQESRNESWFCAACAVCYPNKLFGGRKNCALQLDCKEEAAISVAIRFVLFILVQRVIVTYGERREMCV